MSDGLFLHMARKKKYLIKFQLKKVNIQTTTTKAPQQQYKVRSKDESDIKTKIREFLEPHGAIVIFLIVSNLDGEPDVIALFEHPRMYFIETKAKNKKPSQKQLFRHAQLRHKGYTVVIAESVDDVRHLVQT